MSPAQPEDAEAAGDPVAPGYPVASGHPAPEVPAAHLRALGVVLERVIAELTSAEAPDEALATVRRGRFTKLRRMDAAGRAWRLGVLLLDRRGTLYSTGSVTRAIAPLRAVTNRSPEAEARREDRRAAVRGRFPEGEVVNFGFTQLDPIALHDGPLSWSASGVVLVQWNPRDATARRPIDGYLAERMGMLLEGLEFADIHFDD